MKLYRFSPINDEAELMDAMRHIHAACFELCKNTLGYPLPAAGNMGVFCHYDSEYADLIKIRERLTEPSDDPNQKYFKLRAPIEIEAQGDVPKTIYTHLYIRKPDPYRHHVGDVDFVIEEAEYERLKEELQEGKTMKGARIFPRTDLDMIELYNPDVDALGYVSPREVTEKVRKKII